MAVIHRERTDIPVVDVYDPIPKGMLSIEKSESTGTALAKYLSEDVGKLIFLSTVGDDRVLGTRWYEGDKERQLKAARVSPAGAWTCQQMGTGLFVVFTLLTFSHRGQTTQRDRELVMYN
jgi:hypothetical protein